MSEEQIDNNFPQIEVGENSPVLERKLKQNARSIKWSRRIRWTSRILFFISGATVIMGMFYPKVIPSLAGWVCPASLVFFLSAAAMFLTGGFTPSFVRPFLSDRDKKTLGD